ncbi:MAG: hypothetical protein RBS68_06810 [Anaerolineales bacterium]|jgi:hypothetical protein|nr:hypothetical protein [Anaerolineales bacterium]
MNSQTPAIIPIYSTRGDVECLLIYPYLYNRQGEWVGFVQPNRDVYSVIGYYVGEFSDDKRILRKRALDDDKARLKPPCPPPGRPRFPATFPLPPMMRELSHSTIDVLEEMPEKLHPLGTGEFEEDLD